jgi:hypothetical protein
MVEWKEGDIVQVTRKRCKTLEGGFRDSGVNVLPVKVADYCPHSRPTM